MQVEDGQTSIRISKRLLSVLKSMKDSTNESYEEIIWDAIEPYLELNDKTKKEIEEALAEYKRGEYYTLKEVREMHGLE